MVARCKHVVNALSVPNMILTAFCLTEPLPEAKLDLHCFVIKRLLDTFVFDLKNWIPGA